MTLKSNMVATKDSEEITLKDLLIKIGKWWRYLFSRWLIILSAGIFGAILGVTYSLIKKPLFKAELSFALDDDKSSSGGLGAAMGLASQFGLDLGGTGGGGAFSGDNLLGLMKSRSMVERTLLTTISIGDKNETLANLYIDFNKVRKQWGDKPELKNIQFLPGSDQSKYTLQQDSVLGVFFRAIVKDNLYVDKIDKKLSIITVRVISENELFSKYFAEVLVKNVSDFYVNTKTKKSVQNVNILQRQTDSVRRELNAAITGVAASTDVNPNANPALQILRTPSQKRQVDVQANTAILTQLVANLEMSKISLRKETPLIQVIDSPILPLEKEKFGKLKGIILGGFVFSFFIVFFLVLKRVVNGIIR